MELQAVDRKILTYLQRHSPVNTFRLSRQLEIDRGKLIDIIRDLANEGLAKFEHGSVSIIDKSNQILKNKEEKPADLSKPFPVISLQTQANGISQKFAKVRKPHNKVRKKRVNAKKSLAHKEKSFGLKKVRVKKKAKKSKTERIRLSKEKQEALDWIRLTNLDIEKLKIEIRLLSLFPNPEETIKLRDSIAKLKDMIDQKIRENISFNDYSQS